MSGTIPVSALLEILAAKDAEIKKLKKEKDELAEELRRIKLEKENSARPSEPIEQTPGRHLDDVWSAINELKRRQDDPEVQIIEDPDPAPSVKRIRLDRTQTEIDGLKEKIESVQNEAQASINNLRKQYADINNRLDTNTKYTILLIGGRKNNKEFAGPLVLSSDRSKWLEVKLKLPHIVFGCGVVYYNEELYLIGGWNNLKALYKLGKNRKWIRLTDMNIGRYRIVNRCIAWNGYIWVFGGEDERKNVVTSIERYDVKENKWQIVQDMKHARESVPVIVWKNRIVLVESDVGTACPKKTATAELLNPDGSWTKLPNLPKRRIPHPTISYKEKIIIRQNPLPATKDVKFSCYKSIEMPFFYQKNEISPNFRHSAA